ncbi:MAG: DNA repair protein RecO [Lachnospiraceae bacterium]
MGDYDRRITILTKERGKIGVFAKGARRPGSAFLAYTQVCVFGEFVLYKGRNSYNLSDAVIKNYFPELRNDVEKAYYGMYFCEIADYMSREDNDEKEALKLLYASLRALATSHIPSKLIRAVYEIKITYVNGEGPLLDECVNCHKKPEHRAFSPALGGCVCSDCRENLTSEEYLDLNESSWYTLWFIASTPPEKLYTFAVSDVVLNELLVLGGKYLKVRTNHDFEGAELLKILG